MELFEPYPYRHSESRAACCPRSSGISDQIKWSDASSILSLRGTNGKDKSITLKMECGSIRLKHQGRHLIGNYVRERVCGARVLDAPTHLLVFGDAGA